MATPYFPLIGTTRKQDAQTIHCPLQAYVGINSIPFAAPSNTLDVSTVLATALATAARASQPVPLVASLNDEMRGVVTRPGLNRVLVYQNGTRKIEVNGQEVFGRVTDAGPVFTVEFFTIDAAGAETTAIIPVQGVAGLSLEIPYLFNFHEIPSNALIAVTTRNVKEDIDAIASQPLRSQELTIATLNTIPSLAVPPNITTGTVFFDYRGFGMSSNLPRSVMTVDAAGGITYDAVNAGIDLYPGEVLSVYYTPA